MGQNLTKTRANWQRRLQTVLGITLIFGLFGCFAPEEGPINVIELEPGKPEWASDASERIFGEVILTMPVSYDLYSRNTFNKENFMDGFSANDIETGISMHITKKTKNQLELFNQAKKEGMQCLKHICFRHYCTWQSYIKDGVHKRATPRYCIDLAIKPSACFPQSADCVNVTNFTVSE